MIEYSYVEVSKPKRNSGCPCLAQMKIVFRGVSQRYTEQTIDTWDVVHSCFSIPPPLDFKKAKLEARICGSLQN